MGLEYTPYTPYKRYKLEISYDGSDYCGWQIQPHSPSVQQTLQETLEKLYKHPIHLIGSSRTDTGVHALGFVASFITPEQPDIPAENLMKVLNRRLPYSIRIRSAVEVPLAFHSRYDALGKAYTYVLNYGPESPFSVRYSWKSCHTLDPEKIKAVLPVLTGTHDYSSFVVERSAIDDAVRTIYRIDYREFGHFGCVTFVGNGFLYKMIRCLMGTIEAAGAGKLSPEAVKRILEAKQRLAAPETAPPNGLFLMQVFYGEELLQNYETTALPFTC